MMNCFRSAGGSPVEEGDGRNRPAAAAAGRTERSQPRHAHRQRLREEFVSIAKGIASDGREPQAADGLLHFPQLLVLRAVEVADRHNAGAARMEHVGLELGALTKEFCQGLRLERIRFEDLMRLATE